MAYSAQVIVPPSPEKRAARRRAVNFRAFVRETSAQVFTVEVIDVSADGCRFTSDEPFETATNVWLKISGLTAREARIIWQHGTEYGCEYLAPMQASLVDELCAARQRELLTAAKGRTSFGRAEER